MIDYREGLSITPEHEASIWQEYHDAMDSFYSAVKISNERLLNVLSNSSRKRVLRAMETVDAGSYNTKLQIVREIPTMATYDRFERCWYISTPYGDSGDSFFGNCYVKVRANRWVEIPWNT